MRMVVLVIALWGASASTVWAQAVPRPGGVELEGGGGYSVGGGFEGHAPSMSTWTAGLTVWVSRHWGLSASRVVGIGEDPVAQPPEGLGNPLSDRDYLAQTRHRFWRGGVKYRRGTGPWRVIAGIGLVRGEWGERFRLREDGRILESTQQWAGFLLELQGERALTDHLALRVGLTYNGFTDPIVFHPQGTLVLRF